MAECNHKDCSNECFENENKCILHCAKTDKNKWYILKNNKKEWDKEKVIYFWEYCKKESDSDKSTFDSLIPPLPPFSNQVEYSINIEYSTILETLEIYKIKEFSIIGSEVKGNIIFHSKKDYSKLHFIDTNHTGNIKVMSGENVDIYFQNIRVNLINLGKKEKDNLPHYYKTIEIIGSNTHVKTLNMYNLHIQDTFTMNNIKVEKFHSINTIFGKC